MHLKDFKVREIAGPNTVSLAHENSRRCGWNVMVLLSYSPELAPSDFYPFEPLGKNQA
jgi:hypothetical protein